MYGDVTMTDKCEQDMPSSNMHVNKNFQINTFYKFKNLDSIINSSCTIRKLLKMCILDRGSEIWQIVLNHIVIAMLYINIFSSFTHVLCDYNVWFLAWAEHQVLYDTPW